MTSNSVLEPPFRLSTSEIASLWSEETGRLALEIREDLETWLEAFGQEDTLSRDDQLLRLMGVRWVDRASLLTYCRNRGLEFPEFWFSETIAREKSTGRRSDGPEPDHIASSGSNMGSDRRLPLDVTVESLMVTLDQADEFSERASAARTLGLFGPAAKAAVPILQKLLDDPDLKYRAKIALMKISVE